MTPPSMLGLVQEYLAFRRGLGFKLKDAAGLLLDFARYADRVEHHGHLTIELQVQWALSRPTNDPTRPAQLLSIVRQFARYRAAFDPLTEIPPAGLLGRFPRRKAPHIYSDSEIAELLREASGLSHGRGLRPRAYVVLFSLLVSTGLRISEACGLLPADVDLVEGLLTIRETKFRKSRLVPLHSTATDALRSYAAVRNSTPATRPGYFFRSDRSPALTRRTVDRTFREIRHRLDWTSQGRARRPRIHDMRHTFVVRRILRWYEQGEEIDRKILSLATYLGHTDVNYTYWYISAVPELMAITCERFERFARVQGGVS